MVMFFRWSGWYSLLLGVLLLGVLKGDDDLEYTFSISKHSPYLNEAVVLEVNLTQKDPTKVMLFKFSPLKSEDYRFYQIGFSEEEGYHRLKQHYRYLLYPKRQGVVEVGFKLIKSITDDEKVAYAISGDRDNVKGLVKQDIPIAVKPLKLLVKPLPDGVEMVGQYRLDYRWDRNQTDAYVPVHLHVELKGWGDLESFAFLSERSDYHLFGGVSKLERFHSSKGTALKIVWDYALSAKESFMLPKIEFQAFDPIKQEQYSLRFPASQIVVHPVSVEEILDHKEDTSFVEDNAFWSGVGWFFSYFLVFIAGYLTPRGWRMPRHKVYSTAQEEKIKLKQEIKKAKSHKALLDLLLKAHREEFNEAIERLEMVLYRNQEIELNRIKEMLDAY